MRDINRIKTLTDELAKTWKTFPNTDMRFGQFISNFMGWVMDPDNEDVKALNYGYPISDIWFPEEDFWIEVLKIYRGEKTNAENGNKDDQT